MTAEREEFVGFAKVAVYIASSSETGKTSFSRNEVDARSGVIMPPVTDGANVYCILSLVGHDK